MTPPRRQPANATSHGSPEDGSPVPGRSARDVGRAAVYAAEERVARIMDRAIEFPVCEIAGSHITLPPERHFADRASIQRYVDGVLALAWVRERWPESSKTPVTVRSRRGTHQAHYERSRSTIAIPIEGRESRWALRELVVLHELAHHFSGDAGPAHGPSFAHSLLELMDGVMGAEAALLLRVAFADEGVDLR